MMNATRLLHNSARGHWRDDITRDLLAVIGPKGAVFEKAA